MTLTIQLPPDIEAGLVAQAQAEGLDVPHYVENLVRKQVIAQAASSGEYVELSPEEWVRKFRAWSLSHAGDDLPILSDEAISREVIYEDRGLKP